MIFGIGTDIVEVKRIMNMNSLDKFAKKILSFEELKVCKSLIEENSGTTVSSITKKLNYLIIGEKPTKRKVESAKELKIDCIDQNQFLKMLNKTS